MKGFLTQKTSCPTRSCSPLCKESTCRRGSFGQQEREINISKRLYHLSVCVVPINEAHPSFGVTGYYVSVCGEYAIGSDSESASATSIRQFNRNYRVFNGIVDIC